MGTLLRVGLLVYGNTIGSGTVGVWEHYWEWDCWGMGTLLGVGLLGYGNTIGVWEHYCGVGTVEVSGHSLGGH